MSITPAGISGPTILSHPVPLNEDALIQGPTLQHAPTPAPPVPDVEDTRETERGIAEPSAQEHEDAKRAAVPPLPAGEVVSSGIQLVQDYETFLKLKPAWTRLEEEAGLKHPFLTFEWIQSWWECFGAGKELHILLLKKRGRLRAVAPLMRSTEKWHGITVRCLSLIYNPHTPRCDFLVARHAEDAYLAIWRHLWRVRKDWDVLVLSQLPPDSRTLLKFRKFASAGHVPMGIWKGEKSPYIFFGTKDGYPDGPSRKEEKSLQNRLNRLSKLGKSRTEVISSADQAEEALADGFRLEAAGWKGHAGTAIISEPGVSAFYRKLAGRAAAQGWLHLHFLSVEDRRIAFAYELCYKNRLFRLKSGYDPEFAQCAPSRLLISMTLRDALARGFTEYDMLGWNDEWKLKWTNLVRQHSWLFIYPRTSRGFLLHSLKFGLSPWIHRILSFFRKPKAARAAR